jgi:hypothetical protein
VNTLVGGLLVVAPIYIAVLLLLKAMQSSVGLVRPFAMLLPEWFPAENVLSLLLVLIVCFLTVPPTRVAPRGACRDGALLRLLRRRYRCAASGNVLASSWLVQPEQTH